MRTPLLHPRLAGAGGDDYCHSGPAVLDRSVSLARASAGAAATRATSRSRTSGNVPSKVSGTELTFAHDE
jgi:hypothetical protein